jgi:hypothetical protein
MSVTLRLSLHAPQFYPDCLRQEKMRKSAPDMAAHRLGQVEAYFTVREVLSEASTAADGALLRERSGFCRCRYATLGLTAASKEPRTKCCVMLSGKRGWMDWFP